MAIVGAGRFANIAVRAWERLPDVRVTAVADTRPDAARALAARLGAATVSPVDAVGGRVADVAYIATPPWLQPRYSSMAVRAGMHVVCEKPMALSEREIDQLSDAANSAGRVVTPDFMQRHGALAAGVRRVIEQDSFGAPLRAYFENYAADEELPADHWFWDRSRSGGIFVEHAVHFFDLFRWWFGEGEVVSSIVVSRNPGRAGIQDQVRCTARHGMVLVDQYHGFHQPARLDRQRLGVLFERGDIALDGWIPTSATIRAVVDASVLDDLVEIFDADALESVDVPAGVRGRGRNMGGTLDVMISTAHSDKSALYLELLEARFRDAVAAIRDPHHVQRVTAADAAAAVKMALDAARIATVIDPECASHSSSEYGSC